MGGSMSRMVVIAAGFLLLAGRVAAQGQPDLLFQAEAQTLSGTCTGQLVRLEGNHNIVTLHGACGALLLKGVSNTVRMSIVSGGSIRVEGSGNRVHYAAQGAAPAIVALGPDNDVAAGEPPAMAPPKPAALPAPVPALVVPPPKPPPVPTPQTTRLPTPQAPSRAAPQTPSQPAAQPQSPLAPQALQQMAPLALAGDDVHGLATCAGRDVIVTGTRSDYVLRGDCKSLTLRGDLLTVQAEIVPGAKVTVTGRGSVVTWAVKGRGHGPASIVRGEGSRVQALLANRGPG